MRAFLSLGQGEPLPRSGIAREINLLSCASCLSSRTNSRAARDYLRILDLAAKQSETGVDAVLGRLLEWNVPITPTVVADHLAHDLGLPRAMEVTITTVDLSMYDRLLETREDMPLTDLPTCTSP